MIKKLKDICEFIDGELYGDGEIEIRGVAGIKEARQNEITFAQALRSSGYRTFFAGKWHLGDEGTDPEDFGFEIKTVRTRGFLIEGIVPVRS